MDSVAIWLDLNSDENPERVQQIERRYIRDKSNVMELTEKRFYYGVFIKDIFNPMNYLNSSFVQNYRLSKDAFMYLLNNISSELNVRTRQTSVPNIIKVSATLKFVYLFPPGSIALWWTFSIKLSGQSTPQMFRFLSRFCRFQISLAKIGMIAHVLYNHFKLGSFGVNCF